MSEVADSQKNKTNEQPKPKIGIITFHRTISYGAVLQTYALQKTYQKLGCDALVIDYRNDFLETQHKKTRLKDCRSIIGVVRHLCYSRFKNKTHDLFRSFLSNKIKITSPCFNKLDLKSLTSQFDRVVTGSDQVWNYEITNQDKMYLLEFCDDTNKKCAYAASFGLSSLPDEISSDYKPLLSSFGFLSVRERQGQSILNNLGITDSEIVIDPTMLLSKEEWFSVAENYSNNNYILIFAFGRITSTMKKFVEELAKSSGLEIVYMTFSFLRSLNATYEKVTGPEKFLGLFKNAQYVVTNSFHGTAFSILFNKHFFVEKHVHEQELGSRLKNILNVFNLRNREISDGHCSAINSPIDYETVNSILAVEREKSLEFIKRTIKI